MYVDWFEWYGLECGFGGQETMQTTITIAMLITIIGLTIIRVGNFNFRRHHTVFAEAVWVAKFDSVQEENRYSSP